MMYQAFAVKALLSLSSLLGVGSVSLGEHQGLWQTDGTWTRENGYLTFEARSEKIPALCRQQPDGVIEFPNIIQGAHDIFLDGQLIEHYGDREFRSVEKFYGRPVVKCALASSGKVLVWKVSSAADYFARILFLPTVTTRASLFNLFAQTLHTAAAGALIVIGVYTLFLFYGPVSLALTFSVFLSCILMSLYFLICASDDFALPLKMLTAHKLADSSLWFGLLMLFNAYRIEGILGGIGLLVYCLAGIVGVSMIIFGQSCDQIQLGTIVPFASAFLNVWILALKSVGQRAGLFSSRQRMLQMFSLFAFLAGLTYDMCVITGLLNFAPLMPLTQTGGVLFLVFSVNQRITVTYEERDHLRSHLEDEVQVKTQELRKALGELRSTQAELVQSAKLASLGTLAAGIAHEINNSLNYVNGSLGPLQKIVQNVPDLAGNEKVRKLFGAMNEGMRLSVDIIASLRNYTGLNQAKYNDVVLATVVKSVLTILRPRTPRSIMIDIQIDPAVTVFGSVVGLNQILMNLITNALDAMPEVGTLSILAQDLGDRVELKIRDTGGGIPNSVIERMFEPFFTTKEIGKGTGLGLHIVKNEIEKHNGTLTVASEVGKGTTFTMLLPKMSDSDLISQAERKTA